MNQNTTRLLMKICLWAVIWSAGIGLIKIAIFTLFGFGISFGYIAGLLAAFLGNTFWGVLIGFLIFSKTGSGTRILGYMIGLATLIFYVASFHYELAFQSLPGPSLFYYAKEFSHIIPSIKSNAPLGIVFCEIFTGVCLLFPGKKIVDIVVEKRLLSKKVNVFNITFIFFCLFSTVTLHLFTSVISNQDFFWGSRNPILWLVQTSLISTNYENNGKKLFKNDIWDFQFALGHRIPSGGMNKKYPLWAGFRKTSRTKFSGKSVIVLILEHVGKKELFSTKNGVPIMPNLQKIAKENLFFQNAYAGGTISAQVLPAIFSGIPSQTHTNILWKKPLPRLDGLPFLLRKYGYKTAYFHGSDLSFEQQRSFLKMVGFEHIFDYDTRLEKSVSGWGYDDREMFSILKGWIEKQDSPYFATLFTLSTHDPFILPDDWKSKFSSKKAELSENGAWIGVIKLQDRYELYQESLHFLDSELGKFYAWYKKEEMPKGTLLVFLSDHTTSFHNESPGMKNDHMRFSIPLIFAGLPTELVEKYKNYTNRRVSHIDLPSTITGYIGVDSLPCDQGLDLFVRDEDWPDNRLIYSVGGRGLESVYVWTSECQVVLDRVKNKLDFVNYEIPENAVVADKRKALEAVEKKIIPFLKVLFPLNNYLISNNAYSPTENQMLSGIKPLPAVKDIMFVSHRGNTNGPRKKENENKAKAIEAAINEGFDWVEVDVVLTKNSVPVLLHDYTISDGNGNELLAEELTLNDIKQIAAYSDILTLEEALGKYLEKIGFLIDVKPSILVDRNYILNRKIVNLVKENPLRHKIIIDSFNDVSANYIKNRCNCNVGIDTPYKEMLSVDILRSIKFAGMDWIYVHYSVVNEDLINKAHELGLRVMVYTVNDVALMTKWSENPPDGIITDRADLKNLLITDSGSLSKR